MSKAAISFLLFLSACGASASSPPATPPAKKLVTKLEMNLSAFGVESDDYPSISVYVDLVRDSSYCARSYYDPAVAGSSYRLSPSELNRVRELLQGADLARLKQRYTVSRSDQPTSTAVIYTPGQKFTVEDYGLAGDYPLQSLYEIVYKF